MQYADGSTSQAKLGFPNWCCADPTTYGSVRVLSMNHRDTQVGPANYGITYGVFYNTIPLDPGKRVASVVLPTNAAVHVFAMAVKG